MTAQGRYSGRADVPLSARGRAQAEAVAARLAAMGTPVAAVFSSPLSRCTATAAAISVALGGAGVTIDDDLIECDFGIWEGQTFADVRQRYPTELDRWMRSTSVAPPGGEPMSDVATRVDRFVARLR